MVVIKDTFSALQENWSDERSKKVLFLTHCLLNENTRYMGGAFCGGVNQDIIALLNQCNVGVVQVACPERIAWGGVYKKKVFPVPEAARSKTIKRLCGWCLPVALFWLNWKMRWLARYTACEIEDFIGNGMTVVGYVGVGGSPACGVAHTLVVQDYLAWSGTVDVRKLSREQHNAAMEGMTHKGEGTFVKYLRRHLRRKGISIPFFEYDLWDEMRGRENSVVEALRAHLDAEGLYKDGEEAS